MTQQEQDRIDCERVAAWFEARPTEIPEGRPPHGTPKRFWITNYDGTEWLLRRDFLTSESDSALLLDYLLSVDVDLNLSRQQGYGPDGLIIRNGNVEVWDGDHGDVLGSDPDRKRAVFQAFLRMIDTDVEWKAGE